MRTGAKAASLFGTALTGARADIILPESAMTPSRPRLLVTFLSSFKASNLVRVTSCPDDNGRGDVGPVTYE